MTLIWKVLSKAEVKNTVFWDAAYNLCLDGSVFLFCHPPKADFASLNSTEDHREKKRKDFKDKRIRSFFRQAQDRSAAVI